MAKKPNDNTDTNEASTSLAQAAKQEVSTPSTERNAPLLQLGKVNVQETPEEVAASGGTPVLRTAFGVGNLAEAGHAPGTVVLGDYVLAKKGEILFLYVVAASRYYKENTEFIPGQRIEAKCFSTAKEIHDLGFSTDWTDSPGGRVRPDYSPAADFILLVEKPEKVVSPDFTLNVDGKAYAFARFYTDKNVYVNAGDPLIKVALSADVPYAAKFEFKTMNKMLGRQPVTLPVTTLVSQTDPVLLEAIAEALKAK